MDRLAHKSVAPIQGTETFSAEEIGGGGRQQEGASGTGSRGVGEYGLGDSAAVAFAALRRQHDDRSEQDVVAVEFVAAIGDGSTALVEGKERPPAVSKIFGWQIGCR